MRTKFTTLLSIIVLLFTVCMIMSGCGDKKSDSTESATVTATEKAANAASDQNNGGNASNQSNDQQNADQQSGGNAAFAGISEEDACSKALANVDGGNLVTIVEHGDYNGAECWCIGVENTTGTLYTCYVSADFCHVEEIIRDDSILQNTFAGTSAQEAGNTAVAAAGGDGWSIVDYSQSSYNGQDAWYVTIQNEDGTVKNGFVIGSNCYFE